MPRETNKRNRRPLTLLVTGLMAGFAVLLWSGHGHAYCRTSVCGPNGDPGTLCVPEEPNDCGKPLYWNSRCIGFSMQKDGSARVPIDTAEQIFDQAFNAWENANCPDGGGPLIQIDVLERVECNEVRYNQQGGNANVIIFRDDVWPYMGQGNTLALTTVTYNLDTGEIFDTDMEVNGTAELTVGDAEVQFDLLSIATHEAGHFLGLAHSADLDATMYLELIPDSVELRSLNADDEAAICAAYPADSNNTLCDPTPRHGFSGECEGTLPEDEGCECHLDRGAPLRSGRPWGAAALGLLLAMGVTRRQFHSS